jgi:hypothetical protein
VRTCNFITGPAPDGPDIRQVSPRSQREKVLELISFPGAARWARPTTCRARR